MRAVYLLAVLLLTSLLCLGQEKSVALDDEGKFYVMDDELRQKLNLFQEYEGFKEARLYQREDTLFFLEVLFEKDSALVRDRVPYSIEQVAELRRNFTELVHTRAPGALLNQEGRGALLVNSAILSCGYYGWAIPAMAEMNNGAAIASTYFFVSAAGILIPYFLTEGQDITRATAMMDGYSGLRGIAHGVAFYYLFDPQKERDNLPIGWGALVSVSERVAFDTWATKSRMTDGQVATIGVGGDAGLVTGAVLASGYDLWNKEHQSATAGLVLGMSAAGIVATKQLADHAHYTRGDAYMLRSIAILGAGIPGAIADAANPGRDVAASIVAAGTIAGMGVGHIILRNRDYTRSEGLSTMMLEFGGAGIGLAIVAAADPDDSAPFAAGAAIGATAGFLLGYSQQNGFIRVDSRKADKLNFELNPVPLLTELPGTHDAAQDHRAKMALNFSYRF